MRAPAIHATGKARLAALAAALEVDGWTPLAPTREGEGWRPVGITPELALEVVALGEQHPALDGVRGRGAVAATWFLEKEAWFAATVAAGGLMTAGKAPPMRALWVQPDEHGLPAGGWAPVEGWQPVTAESIATELTALMAPAVGALTGVRPARALWRSVGDRLGQAFWWAGRALNQSARANALLGEALAADTPLRAPLQVDHERPGQLRRRTGCCLAYRVDSLGRCEDCAVCPKPQR